MDMNKILETVISKSINEVLNKEIDKSILESIKDPSLLKTYSYLMTYSNNLLTEYHEALKAELLKHGIKISSD